MTTRQAHRLLIWAAPLVGLGAAVLAARTYPGMGWGVALTAVAGAVIGALAALLPQESEHRRDLWRDWLRHRERMARLRIATEARPGAQDPHMITNRPADQ
ncbi:hypothetical protein [Streptomyces cyslabdanicus]|uniref:hypothetical protein n=1 Tax=Streptomyces cyslabdanicus TaxID=1470456 RepID=UPI00404416DF